MGRDESRPLHNLYQPDSHDTTEWTFGQPPGMPPISLTKYSSRDWRMG